MPIEFSVEEAVRSLVKPRLEEGLTQHLARMCEAIAVEEGRAEVRAEFSLVSDASIAEINESYRKIEGPTDVLAFATRETPMAEIMPEQLGEVIISVETAVRQCNGDLDAELLTLATHGLCHLLGYDHATAAEKEEMDQRMASLVAEAMRNGPVSAA